MTIELPDHDIRNNLGEKWHPCTLCGTRHKRAELFFDSGSVEPTEDEVFTGATSGDTGVVVDSVLYTGTYAGGDATGAVTLKTLTGSSVDSDTLIETIFQDNEEINGSDGGDGMMTVNGTPYVNKYGRQYPESQMVFRDGKWFCSAHARFRYHHKDIDSHHLHIDEGDRGELW